MYLLTFKSGSPLFVLSIPSICREPDLTDEWYTYVNAQITGDVVGIGEHNPLVGNGVHSRGCVVYRFEYVFQRQHRTPALAYHVMGSMGVDGVIIGAAVVEQQRVGHVDHDTVVVVRDGVFVAAEHTIIGHVNFGIWGHIAYARNWFATPRPTVHTTVACVHRGFVGFFFYIQYLYILYIK